MSCISPYTGSFLFTVLRRLKLRNNKLPIKTVSVSGPAYPSKGESTSMFPYPAIDASTHCHQCPSISPSTRGYFFGMFTSLFNESGSNLGWLPPQPCLLYTSDAADERSSVDLG